MNIPVQGSTIVLLNVSGLPEHTYRYRLYMENPSHHSARQSHLMLLCIWITLCCIVYNECEKATELKREGGILIWSPQKGGVTMQCGSAFLEFRQSHLVITEHHAERTRLTAL